MFSSKSLAALTAALLATTASVAAAETFNRIASFPVELNNPEAEASSSEIITATGDGMTLIYSDSPAGGIGFVDITDPKAPKQGGFMDLGGEPTSVTVIGGKAYVAVNTSEDFINPTGKLVVVDIATKAVDGEFELGGQPDSIAHNKGNTILAIAIENERDEEVSDGDLPQAPSGFLVLVNLVDGAVTVEGIKKVELTGLSEIAPEDAELPVVTKELVRDLIPDLQSNNGYVVDKVESFAIDATGTGYVITDNDGVDDSSGETFFWSIGAL